MVALDLRSIIREERLKRTGQQEASPGKETKGCLTVARGDPDNAEAPEGTLARAGRALDPRLHAVGSNAIKGLYYVPEYLTTAQEQAVLRRVDAAPAVRWTDAGERRIQNWGGRPGEAAVREPLPPFVQALVDGLVANSIFAAENVPNHCLVNDYRGGAGIPPHTDGPLYSQRVATITLGGPALIKFHRPTAEGKAGEVVAEVLLQPRCLLLVAGAAYQCLHSISSEPYDVISPCCVNCDAAQVEPGMRIQRSQRRTSLVFVTKHKSS